MKRVLIVYGSETGCTAGVAERIGRMLEAQGAHVDLRAAAAKPDPSVYDAVVAGCGARAGNWYGPARKWVVGNAGALGSKPLAMFTVGIALAHGPDKEDEMRRYTDAVLAKSGVKPVDLGVFAGWYVPSEFNFVQRKVMELAKSPEGDHRDWAAIESWATTLAPKLGLLEA